LVITRISVQEGKPCAARRRVDDLIDTGEWKGILRPVFIESGMIDTDATNVCVILGNQYWVGNPSRCFDLLDEPNVFEMMEFSCYSFALWFVELL
jgi:hypothetical protein